MILYIRILWKVFCILKNTGQNKENIMSPKQYQKVKLWRVLKVLFYCLGLPLFTFAVFLTSIKFIGHDPFNGHATATAYLGMFQGYERFFTGSALMGVWLSFGIWAIIAIFQIIFAKTIKNRRARMFATVAITLVLMLGALLVIDTVYSAKFDGVTNPITGEHTKGLSETAPDGVEVKDYRTLLSYYRTVSTTGQKKNMTTLLIDKIDAIERVYNVEWDGMDKTGTAGNVGNDPITYATIISDDGVIGVDISFVDGKLALEEQGKAAAGTKGLLSSSVGYTVTNNQIEGDGDWDPDDPDYRNSKESKQVVKLAPTPDGKLKINGEVYSHYVCVTRTDLAGNEHYTWYARDLYPVDYDFENMKGIITDGIYGKGIYNSNGLFADGWVFSVENVLEILEDYYAAPIEINKRIKEKELDKYDVLRAQTIADAAQRRIDYYTSDECDPWLAALYTQEFYYSNKFSFTHYRLDELLAEVGEMLGRNHLFDFLLADGSMIGDLIGPILTPLRNGTGLRAFLKGVSSSITDETCDKVIDIIKKIADDETMTDAYIKLSYPALDDEDGHFILVVKENDENGDVILDLDFSNELLEYKEENPDFAFDLDHLSAFLNKVLNKFINLDSAKGTINTVLGLVGGMFSFLDTSDGGVTLTFDVLTSKLRIKLLDADYKFALDIDDILLSLLDGLYYYQSSAIEPVWNFYVDPDETDKDIIFVQTQFADMDRAYFTGTKYGALIGSTLIGKTVGGNLAMSGAESYDSKYGLTDLVSVQQVKSDLSYQPQCFPIFALREMLGLLSGVVVLFVFLSFFAAEKEYLYATGQIIAGEKKGKKAKKGEEPEGAEENADAPKEEEKKDEPAKEEPAPQPAQEQKQEEAPQEEPKKGKKEKPKKEEKPPKEEKPKKEKKSKKDKGDQPAPEEGADVPADQNNGKEVRK